MRLEELPPVPGVQHRYVRAGGAQIHVAEAGTGRPVLMLHGWPEHWYLWRGVIARLDSEYRLICPDLPGLGWSDPPRGGYAKENLASRMLDLMDELGLDRVLLVGHDWGAWIGFLMCLRAPERFEAYLAMDVPPPFQEPSVGRLMGLWRLWYQALIASPVLGELALRRWGFHERILRAATGPGFTWPAEDLEAFVAPIREAPGARASVALYRSFLLREMASVAKGRYRESRLVVPTLLLAGEHDAVAGPEVLEPARKFADQLEIEIVNGAGHFLVDERPELVADRARTLFSRHRP